MVSFTLKNAGYDVVEASDGMDGLAKAKTQGFNLVLTDQNMPRMDGLTLIKNLRGLPQYKATPILMLTTESSDAMKAQGKAAGAQPGTAGTLTQTLSSVRVEGSASNASANGQQFKKVFDHCNPYIAAPN